MYDPTDNSAFSHENDRSGLPPPYKSGETNLTVLDKVSFEQLVILEISTYLN
jgi:hypothetical protein